MKKIYHIIVLCLMVFALVGCDSINKNRLNEALANNDFEKAYQYAKALEEDNSEDFHSEIIKKESKYVLESQGYSGLARIQMIVNDHDAPWVYLDVLKMAIAMGNEDLAIKIFKMSGTSCDEQCIDYAVTADMKELVVVMLHSYVESMNKQSVKEYLTEKGIYEQVEIELADEIEEAFYSSIPELEGERPTPGLNGYYYGRYMMDVPNDEYATLAEYFEVSLYYHSVKKINTACMRLLDKAIQDKNKERANKVITRFVQDVEVTLGGDGIKVNGVRVDGKHSYIKFTNASKDVAKQRLQDAIKDGAFK